MYNRIYLFKFTKQTYNLKWKEYMPVKNWKINCIKYLLPHWFPAGTGWSQSRARRIILLTLTVFSSSIVRMWQMQAMSAWSTATRHEGFGRTYSLLELWWWTCISAEPTVRPIRLDWSAAAIGLFATIATVLRLGKRTSTSRWTAFIPSRTGALSRHSNLARPKLDVLQTW